ncbi:MAG TPA: hypothetical protein VG734_22765 [Lacunisphaera sp.]|nr:hypothetical protein [Lacunisphaera sp.]
MDPAERLNELALRKRLLVAQSALHRQMISLEGGSLATRGLDAGHLAVRHRWWLLGGALVAGVVMIRHRRALGTWLPLLITAARTFTR